MTVLRMPVDVRATLGDVLRVLRDDERPFALTGRWAGGGALVGSSPVRTVSGPDALRAVDELPVVDGPAGVVGGGWFGVLGYGLGAAIERLPPGPPRPVPVPAATLGFYEWVLRLDARARWWFEALSDGAAMRDRHAALVARLRRGPADRRPWRLDGMRLYGAGGDAHRAAVAECVERIAAGELFQANVCLRLDGAFAGSAADAYVAAAGALTPAYGAFFGGLPDGGAVLSLSPELFLRRERRSVWTGPVKGTAPRPPSDAARAERARSALVASAKDAAEHVMIVDLMRNDLGRVARYGTVAAEPSPVVEPHPGLWHLVTRVGAELREGVGDEDLLRATFPPGSVTGAPKVQAMKVIAELEGSAREAYTGAIGYVSPLTGLELNVAIRTLEVARGRAWLGAGGGVVADSDPDAELREALGKARPIVEALGGRVPDPAPLRPFRASRTPRLRRLRRPDPAAGILTTMAVRDGVAVLPERHLSRLAASAEELYGIALPSDLPQRVALAAAGAGRGLTRLRVVVAPSGAVDVMAGLATASATGVLLEPVVLAGGLGAHKWADRTPLDDLDGAGRTGLICDLDGSALEAGTANLWALEGRRLVTPAADGRLLPGVTRDVLLALGPALGVDVVEDVVELNRLGHADGLLLTSSIRVAVPASLAGTRHSARAVQFAAAIRAALGPLAGISMPVT